MLSASHGASPMLAETARYTPKAKTARPKIVFGGLRRIARRLLMVEVLSCGP